jgi:hypothetical protein
LVRITKSSTVDKEVNLGFLASWEDIHQYGVGARKVFLSTPPTKLNRSFAQAVEMRSHTNQPWKRQSEDEWGEEDNRGFDEGNPRFKR